MIDKGLVEPIGPHARPREFWARRIYDLPSFWAMLASRSRSIEDFALAPVELGDVARTKSDPGDAVCIDVGGKFAGTVTGLMNAVSAVAVQGERYSPQQAARIDR